jgi:glycolate oxidase
VYKRQAEDINYALSPKPAYLAGFQLVIINVTAHTEDELAMKTRIIRQSLKEYYESKEAGFMPVPPNMKTGLMEVPQKALSKFADVRKGGGFEYVGAIMPVEKIPEACRAGMEITERCSITYSMGARIIGRGHSAMFFFAYPFNRADSDEISRVRNALDETNEAVLKIGGIPWKTEASGQQLILQHMEPGTYDLMSRVRRLLDPNGIMNPGNWEVT